MNTDDALIRQIDLLVTKHLSFAIYRLPWKDELHLILQDEAEPRILHTFDELNGERGFVMAPFRSSEKCPLLLIHPDCVLHSTEEILNLTVDNFPSHPTEVLTHINPDTRERYEESFRRFHAVLEAGELRKLVLSRRHLIPLPETFSAGEVFIKACRLYPRVMNYICYTPISGLWMGCTPEILLSVEHGEGHTVSLAGTQPVVNNVEPTTWDEKNQHEQSYVSEYIRTRLAAHGLTPHEEGPYTARAGEVVHLKTDFFFPMPDTHHLGDLLASLHPTPAVCGLPKAEAYRFIHKHEALDRRYYTGFIGWTDPNGDTELYVNLRCMEIQEHKAVLYAGGGILSSSDVRSEWEETEHKLGTIERILTD